LIECDAIDITFIIKICELFWFNRLNYAKSALAMPETFSRCASWFKADFLLIWKAGILAGQGFSLNRSSKQHSLVDRATIFLSYSFGYLELDDGQVYDLLPLFILVVLAVPKQTLQNPFTKYLLSTTTGC
jgi:hypothetical protein